MRSLFLVPLMSFVGLASACGPGAPRSSSLQADGGGEPTSQLLFTQLVDHDAGKSSAVFQQRYFQDSTFASGPDAPVILYICGEGPCSADEMTFTIGNHAEKFHAHMVALEHRYYGASFPVPDFTTPNMKYLSVEQALADLTGFIEAKRGEGLTGKWVSAGGSYPGVLSAYLRLKHPRLIAGALSSSGPVRAKENFEEYDFHISKVLGPDCADAHRALIAEIDGILEKKNEDPKAYAKLMADFGATTDTRVEEFGSGVSSPVGGIAQYGSPKREDYCKIVQGENAMTAFAAFIKAMNEQEGTGTGTGTGTGSGEGSDSGSGTTMIVSHIGVTMHHPGATDLPDESTVGGVAWLWQMCTEFGFLPTAYHDRSISVYSKFMTLDHARKFCSSFGIEGPVNVDKINHNYYEHLLAGKASNILYTNGSEDPWSELSFTGAVKGNDVSTFVMDGAHHCADLSQAEAGEPASLQKGRDLFDSALERWFKD